MKHIRLLLLASLLFAASILSCSKHESSPKDGDPAVRAFLENYFRTWSNQDMDGYASCFQDSARITFVTDAKGTLHTETLSDFLHGQRMGHKTATEPMRETADSMIVHSDDRAAIARVPWTLIKGNQRSTGIDHFSLIKTPAGWRIVHLLFYSN